MSVVGELSEAGDERVATNSLELVKFDQHNRLLWAQVSAEHLAHIRYESDHDRKAL
jgi:hypothetical protein